MTRRRLNGEHCYRINKFGKIIVGLNQHYLTYWQFVHCSNVKAEKIYAIMKNKDDIKFLQEVRKKERKISSDKRIKNYRERRREKNNTLSFNIERVTNDILNTKKEIFKIEQHINKKDISQLTKSKLYFKLEQEHQFNDSLSLILEMENNKN